MGKEVSEPNWEEIMAKFSSYDGVIAEFCRANNIRSKGTLDDI